MLGTLPPHAKKSWSEWVATLTHAYNCTMSQTTGFSPFILVFGGILKIPISLVSLYLTYQTPVNKTMLRN